MVIVTGHNHYQQQTRTRTQRKMKILIAEDSEQIAMIYRRILRDHDTTIVDNAPAAISALEHSGPFDVVISDFDLIEGTGQDVFDASKTVAPAVFFVLATGRDDVSFGDLVLRKPFSPTQIRDLFSEVPR